MYRCIAYSSKYSSSDDYSCVVSIADFVFSLLVWLRHIMLQLAEKDLTHFALPYTKNRPTTRQNGRIPSAVDASFGIFRDLNVLQWPRLSRIVLKIYETPPTKADNGRLYSEFGDMVTNRRIRLSVNTIGAAQCLRQWHEDGIIE